MTQNFEPNFKTAVYYCCSVYGYYPKQYKQTHCFKEKQQNRAKSVIRNFPESESNIISLQHWTSTFRFVWANWLSFFFFFSVTMTLSKPCLSLCFYHFLTPPSHFFSFSWFYELPASRVGWHQLKSISFVPFWMEVQVGLFAFRVWHRFQASLFHFSNLVNHLSPNQSVLNS